MQTDVKLTSYGGVQCLCNIHWHRRADGYAAQLSGKSQLDITWGDRNASIEGEAELEGIPPLLALIVSELEPAEYDGSVLIAFEDAKQSLWLAATLVNGKPALEPEHLFETKADLLQYISDLPGGGHKRLLHSDSLTDALNTLLTTAPLRTPKLDPRGFQGFKKRAPLISKKGKQLLLAASAIVGSVILGSYGWQWYTYVPQKVLDQVGMVTYVEDFSDFAKGCEAAFSQSWPTVPGWTLQREGCASLRMADPDLVTVLTDPAAAFKVFTLNPQHNEILSRRAAASIYANWPHKVHAENRQLLVYSPFDIGLQRYTADQENASTSLKYRIEDAFLGIEEGIVQTNAGGAAQITVTTSAALREVLRRIAALQAAGLKKLTRANGKIKLTFRAPDLIRRAAPVLNPEEDPA